MIAGIDKITLYVKLTNTCNLNCSFCFQKDHTDKGHISLDALMTFISNTPQIDHVVILGGEAFLLKKELRKLLDYLFVRRLQVSFITNGTIYYSWLKDYKSIITDIQISIDGGPLSHNSNRSFQKTQTGSYDTVIQNLHRYKDDKLPIAVHGVISIQTLRGFVKSQKRFYSDIPEDVPIEIEIEHIQRLSIWQNLLIYLSLKRSFALAKRMKRIIRYKMLDSFQGCRLCPAGILIFCADMATGKIYSCEEKIGEEQYYAGDIQSGISDDLIRAKLGALTMGKYRIQYLPRRIGSYFLQRMSFNICPVYNQNQTGKEDVIPFGLFLYYWFLVR